MYGLTVRQKHNSQVAILHLRYLHPTPDAAIGLDIFPNRRPDSLLDPFVPDDSPIRPVTDCLEVASNLHAINVSDFRFDGSCCRVTVEVSRLRRLAKPAVAGRLQRYIRMLLTHGARSVLHAATVAKRSGRSLDRLRTWALAVHARTNHNKATCALANKLARIGWAVWVKHEKYQSTPAPGIDLAASPV